MECTEESQNRQVSTAEKVGSQPSAKPLKGGTIPREWNGVQASFPRDRSVLDFFRVQVQSQPESIAIKEGPRLMTYSELDKLSNRVANELCGRGLKLEEPVVIFLPASCEFLVALMGILKAGGTYLPVDLDTPAERLGFLLQNSASRLILSDVANKGTLGEWSSMVLDVAPILSSSAPAPLEVSSDPNRRAYIFYTSGSTGKPKGVEIEHHALTNLVCHYHRHFKITPQDRASLLAYVAFDVSVADIWPTLCAGGTVTVPPKGILLDPDGLIGWLAEEEITLAFVPTGLVEILFTRPWPQAMKLRYLVTGGDRLRTRPPAGLPFVVLNGYGPTENTVFCTIGEVIPVTGPGQFPSIGRPVDNTTAYVLDEELRPVPENIAGELYVGGEQVARGYVGRPELTAERFLSDPFSNQPKARMYQTGDWVRWLPNGELEFLGRKDGQIQIRGRRVELGEIEAAVLAHGTVLQVCCVPWLESGMPAGVIAHIVAGPNASDLPDKLRAHLQTRVPDYMVPREFVLHEHLPLTPQGKLNRAALINFQAAKPVTSAITPRNDLERALASLWQTLLPGNSSPNDTFAALGGDSMQAIKLMIGVEEIIGQSLEISAFLVKPTFVGLCEAVKARLAGNEFQPTLALRKQGTRPPLICLYGHGGDIAAYFQLAEALGEDQPVFGIRSPALENMARLPQSIEQAAAELIPWIRKIQPEGAPALVGYSWSGLLVYEVARQLRQTDGVECFTAVIGSSAPVPMKNITYRLKHFARHLPSWFWNLATDNKGRWQRLARWRNMAATTKQNLSESVSPYDKDETLTPISRYLLGLGQKYQPPAYGNVTLEVIREREDFNPRAHPLHAWNIDSLPDSGWTRLVRKEPRIHWLDANHATIIKPPAVAELAKIIRTTMDEYLNTRSSA